MSILMSTVSVYWEIAVFDENRLPCLYVKGVFAVIICDTDIGLTDALQSNCVCHLKMITALVRDIGIGLICVTNMHLLAVTFFPV